jgi:FKBP12-rapamycin complex-associated protein
MMKSRSVKLEQIDFGDCFEIAMRRERYPETVPFHLTRLLMNALEVSRIEGQYRNCCENVLRLLRDNNYQIMGLLETFIYAPLLQWTDQYSGKSDTKRSLVSASLR